ncbi:hypothetical protein L596_006272 [Steinernema carpocapsae]|uniref:Uncharacterized protein n=1 Tax=Steinernema carpocapsae TaxID=34508 RepID=A0A4U8V7Q0_STECR|nr:hypothetical protein L596_006272 [Steinernema carpocapsae]
MDIRSVTPESVTQLSANESAQSSGRSSLSFFPAPSDQQDPSGNVEPDFAVNWPFLLRPSLSLPLAHAEVRTSNSDENLDQRSEDQSNDSTDSEQEETELESQSASDQIEPVLPENRENDKGISLDRNRQTEPGTVDASFANSTAESTDPCIHDQSLGTSMSLTVFQTLPRASQPTPRRDDTLTDQQLEGSPEQLFSLVPLCLFLPTSLKSRRHRSIRQSRSPQRFIRTDIDFEAANILLSIGNQPIILPDSDRSEPIVENQDYLQSDDGSNTMDDEVPEEKNAEEQQAGEERHLVIRIQKPHSVLREGTGVILRSTFGIVYQSDTVQKSILLDNNRNRRRKSKGAKRRNPEYSDNGEEAGQKIKCI